MCKKPPKRRKVGDTLTVTVAPADAKVTYEWSINGTVYATSESITVPAIAKSGDRIKVTVTSEDGETASDSVYVGGFSILKVEPTTAMVMGEDTKGYKYVRATFSNPLMSLSEADIEIRNVKTDQLYSVEKVALSTDGYTADITIAGDAAVAGTTFLMPSTIYACTMSSDGLDATLEFQLPDIWSDMLVTSVDVEKNTITVYGSVRKGGQFVDDVQTFNVGDTYDDNLGELVGRTVVLGLDADNNITSLKVNDGAVAFGYVTAKDGDNDNKFTSSKDYFETASGDKYYLSTTYTSSTNESMYVWANNKGGFGFMADRNIDPKDTFEYGKLVLNPNGTVSAAVLWDAFDGHIIATEADGSVAKETSNNSKDFKGYTVIDGFTFEYRDPKSLEDGDIIYYDSDNKLAFIYNESVTGDLENIYEDKLDIDGTKYNFIVWVTNSAVGDIAKQARYYDADNDEYKAVTEKWANTLDKTEPVTIFLDTKGDGVLVQGTVGETVTHSKQYIITKSPKAYINGLSYMMDISVSDGTEVTLHINAADITSMNGDAFGDVTLNDTNGNGFEEGIYEFTINDNDGKQTELVNGKAVKNHKAGNDTAVDATDLQQGSLVEVIYNDDETKVTGLNLILGNQAGMKKGTLNTTIDDINMKEDKDTEFKPGLASIKTDAGSLNLTNSTKVYVLTGTRLPVGETQNDGDQTDPTDPATYRTYNDTTYYKEASDNKVKLYNYSDFAQNTQAGNYALCAIINEADADGDGETVEQTGAAGNPTVGSLVKFVADKTTATAIIIDDRGWNMTINANDAAPHVGTVRAVTDIKGGQVFKTATTETKVLGVATATEYKLNSDGETEQLAEIKILTVEGTVDLDNIDNKIDPEKDAKNKIVIAELDAAGKVTKLNELDPITNAAVVEKVTFGRKVTSTSTDTLQVTTTGATYNVKADTDCLVVKYNGSSYSESSIGDINRDTDYKAIRYYTSQLNGTDVKAKVIVAVKDATGAGYSPVATTITASATTVEAGNTVQVRITDQFGELVTTGCTWTSSEALVADFNPAAGTTGTVTVKGLAVGTADIEETNSGLKVTVTVTAPEAYTAKATHLSSVATGLATSKIASGDQAVNLATNGAAVATSTPAWYVYDQYGVLMKSATIASVTINGGHIALKTTAAGVLTVECDDLSKIDGATDTSAHAVSTDLAGVTVENSADKAITIDTGIV